MDAHALAAAEQQMRLLLMRTGATTLDQINRQAPDLVRVIISTYLDNIRPDFPGMG